MAFDIVDVLREDVCIGCGACVAITDGRIPITLGADGQYRADLAEPDPDLVDLGNKVCPFSDATPDESRLAERLFNDSSHADDLLGRYEILWAGSVADQSARLASSSGGMTTWILQDLMRRREIDGVVHVGTGDDHLFEYRISRSVDEISERRGSRYYAVTFGDALRQVRELPGRYAFVGVPCFVTALRHVMAVDPVMDQRIQYAVGIVCGHMKSQLYAESLAWQLGIEPAGLTGVEFRVKVPGRPAADYDFLARSDNGTASERSHGLVGSNWGHGAMQPNACNYCDDVFGETADITLGDAWIPDAVNDWRGTNVVIARSKHLSQLLIEGISDGKLDGDDIGDDLMVSSQGGNVRHRRIGLAVRLHDDMRVGKRAPRKRVAPASRGVPLRRRKIVRKRREMSRQSFGLFQAAKATLQLSEYTGPMEKLAVEYNATAVPLAKRAYRRVRGYVNRLRGGHGSA